MSSLLILALVVLAVQVVLFFMIRKRKRKLQEPSEIERKYHIRSRADAWKILNNPDLPEAERNEIEDLYKSME